LLDSTRSRAVSIGNYFCSVEFPYDCPGGSEGRDNNVNACYGDVFWGTGDETFGAVGERDSMESVEGAKG
jgi:hypothetical protein